MRRKRNSAAKQIDSYLGEQQMLHSVSLQTFRVLKWPSALCLWTSVRGFMVYLFNRLLKLPSAFRLWQLHVETWSNIIFSTIRLLFATNVRGAMVYIFKTVRLLLLVNCTWSSSLHQAVPIRLYFWLHAEKWPTANRHWDNSQRLKQSLAPVTWYRYLSVH